MPHSLRTRSHRDSPFLRPRLELLEDRVQPGETLLLGFAPLALWGVLSEPAAAPAWIQTLAPAASHTLTDTPAADPAVLLPFLLDEFLIPSTEADLPTQRTARPAAAAAFDPISPLPRLHAPLALVADSSLARGAAPAWSGAPGITSQLPAQPAPFSSRGEGHTAEDLLTLVSAAVSPDVFFDPATGQLILRGSAGDDAVRQTLTADGFLLVTHAGRQHSSDPQSQFFEPALAGAGRATLTDIRFDGRGGTDTLSLGTQTLAHGLRVRAADAEVIVENVTAAGPLTLGAERLTVNGTLRGTTVGLAATGLLNVNAGGAIVSPATQARSASKGTGRIEAVADVFVNVGQLRADGPSGGTVIVQARNVLNAGRISADGDSGRGGVVQVAFTGAYIETTAGVLSARSAAGAGGHVLVTGGPTGRLYTSGTQQATGAVGGAVDLLGREVLLVGGTADASGATAGGWVRVGGDFQGRNAAVVNAQSVTVTSSATICANAEQTGNGGRVIVWADGETIFEGSVSARGGTRGGDGGFIEVSGKGDLNFGGSGDAGAARGKAGRMMLDPKNLVVADAPAGVFPQYDLIDPNPDPAGRFGSTVTVLSSGNVVVTDPSNSFGATNAGAVYLFNGVTGALTSSLVGSAVNDRVGGNGVTPLSNSNYVVASPAWNGLRGAATWGSGVTGVSGPVSAANSLIGTNPGPGCSGNPDLTSDCVSVYGITALANGNYVVASPFWNGLRGAATWGNGTTGVVGPVSAANSLVGDSSRDGVSVGVSALSNGNYVVRSPGWNSLRGAAT